MPGLQTGKRRRRRPIALLWPSLSLVEGSGPAGTGCGSLSAGVVLPPFQGGSRSRVGVVGGRRGRDGIHGRDLVLLLMLGFSPGL